MPGLAPLPFSHAALERYRVRCRELVRPNPVGGHLVRRKGRSLEFRDFRQYVPGDDIRHVDWSASLRQGVGGDLIVRNHVAEERVTLVISVDTRATMTFPDALTKRQVAAWLAEALAVIVLRSDDRVVLHRLFGSGREGIASFRGKHAIRAVRPALERFFEGGETGEDLHIEGMERLLPPTAVWLTISDFYFREEEISRRLASAMARARDGYRWVLTMDLDSWQFEEKLLGRGAREIVGPARVKGGKSFEIDESGLAKIESGIRNHKDRFSEQARLHQSDRLHWSWPPDPDLDPALFFRERFENDHLLQRLFMKEI